MIDGLFEERLTQANCEVYLVSVNRELLNEYLKGFANDPDIFMDMARFEEYRYSEERAAVYYDKLVKEGVAPFPLRYSFMIMRGTSPIGEICLKRVEHNKGKCELSIHMQNDSVKNKGYGTIAERLLLKYAFETLGMNTVLADCVHKNMRSRHVLEKIGFEYVGADELFRYYSCDRERWKKASVSAL